MIEYVLQVGARLARMEAAQARMEAMMVTLANNNNNNAAFLNNRVPSQQGDNEYG